MGARQQQMDELGFGNQATGQQYGMDTQSANYQNTLRQQQISEAMQQRGFSLNEINALISGQQVGMPSMPGFQGAGRAAGVDYSGAAQNQYQADQNAANAQNSFLNSVLGFGAGFIPGQG